LVLPGLLFLADEAPSNTILAKALRFIGYILLLVLVSFFTALILVVRNQHAIAEIALARVQARTGLAIRIAGTRIGLGTHLVVVLEQPRIETNGLEVATLDNIRAVLTYRSIFLNSGLPLAQLVLDHPRIKVPARATGATLVNIPRLDRQSITTLKSALDTLSDTALQVDVVNAALTDQNGTSLVEQLDLRAHRRHHAQIDDWLVDFDAAFNHAEAKGLRLTGSLSLGSQLNHPNLVASGRLWFWGLDLANFDMGLVKASAQLVGNLTLVFDNAGLLSGRSEILVRELLLHGKVPTQNLELGDYTASTSFLASPDLLDLPDLSLHQGSSVRLTGKATVRHLFNENRTLSFDVGDATIELIRIGSWMRAIGIFTPPQQLRLAERFGAGQLVVGRASLDTIVPMRDWTLATLRDNVLLNATIRQAAYQLQPEAHLPSLSHFGAQLDYSSGMLKFIQGSAELGKSRLEDVSAEVNLRSAPGRVPYKFRLGADLDLTELYPTLHDALRTANPTVAECIVRLDGPARLAVEATGNLNDLQWKVPASYSAKLALADLVATVKDAPTSIALRDGAISLAPGLITLSHVRLVPS
jgi:hypothetical protein